MRAGLALVVGIAACGPPQRPTSVTNEQAPDAPRSKKVTLDPVSAAVRPDVDVEYLIPDFHEELRWPLSLMSHPELEPQLNIAQVFAQPGIGWLELCERGIQNRVQSGRNRDELEYLRGWCSAIKGDADAACGKLKPLTASTVLGMSAAVRTDLANIIATAGDIDMADKLLMKYRLDDIELLDMLAATYVELGRERDAYEMNRRALDSVGHTTNATHCRRLVKDIMLGGQSDATKTAQQLEHLATDLKTPDATCVSLHQRMQCRLGPPTNCTTYFLVEGIDTRNVSMLEVSRGWPQRAVPASRWTQLARRALGAVPLTGAEAYTIAAIEAAYAARGTCDPEIRTLMIDAAKQFNEPATKERLVKLLPSCETRH
jgi:hypothetical protein